MMIDYRALASDRTRDPYATPRALRRIADRARRGSRADDAIRGRTTVTTGIWLLSRLTAAGELTVGEDGWLSAGDRPGRVPLDGLVNIDEVADLIDWDDFAEIIAKRQFDANLAWFQSFDTQTSMRRRLAMMENFNDLSGAAVLQLGDDELFGLAMGMVDDVRRVHVGDADPAVLAYIDEQAGRLGLPVTTQLFDVRRDEPPAGDYDTFYASGLKDAGGLVLFLSTGMAAIRPGGAGYLSFDTAVYRAGMSERDVLRDLHRLVDRLDGAVTSLLPCEDRLMTSPMLAELADIVREAAAAGAGPNDVAAALARLREGPQPDGFCLKHGFPDIPLRSAGVFRIECGPRSRELARRHLGRLQQLVS